jgi:phi13 family phage major tail protein
MPTKPMPTIGVKDLYAAQITEDEFGAETFSTTLVSLIGAIDIQVSLDVSQEKLYADDSVYLLENNFGGGTVTINTAALGTANTALLLGSRIDSNGGIVSSADDTPPAFALMFRAKKADGFYRYVCLYKVQFMPPSDTFHTVEDTNTKQTPTIEGTLMKLNKQDSQGKNNYKYTVDEDADGSENIISTWFTEVPEPDFTVVTSGG